MVKSEQWTAWLCLSKRRGRTDFHLISTRDTEQRKANKATGTCAPNDRFYGMALYRIYPLDERGHVLRRWERDCATDAEAIEFAKSQSHSGELEIWQDARQVVIISEERRNQPPVHARAANPKYSPPTE